MHARHAFGSASAHQPFRETWARIFRAVRRQFAWLAREHHARRAVGELMALDDRMLSDIGMDRGSIGFAARYGHLPREHAPLGLRSPAVVEPSRQRETGKRS